MKRGGLAVGLGAIGMGCGRICGDYETSIFGHSEDILVLDGWTPDDNQVPVLHVEDEGDDDTYDRDVFLTAADSGFRLDPSLLAVWEGSDTAAPPSRITLTFRLAGPPAATYTPIEAPGDAETVTLWNGWVLDLETHVMFWGCK